MNGFAKIGYFGLTALCLFALTACGGGGGDDDAGISYTGATTPAAITAANAEDLAAGDYASSLQNLTETVQDAIGELDLLPSVSAAATDQPEAITVTGNCGGQAVIVASANQRGAFSGSVSFQNFCSETVTISGTINFSGTIDTTTLAMQFSTTFDSVQMKEDGEQILLRGTMAWSISQDTAAVTINLLLVDQILDETYKLENFVMTLTYGETYLDLEISGRYYDPAFGYVDIETPLAVRTSYTASSPSQGILLFTGQGGSQARLTFNSDGTSTVAVDLLGNGNFVVVP